MAIIPVSTPVTPEEIVQQLRAVRAQIPDFVQIPKPSAKALVSVAAIRPEFIEETLHAVGSCSALRGALGQSAVELRQDAEFTARWGAVIAEMYSLLATVQSEVTVRKHRIGLTALQVYQISRQLARKPEHTELQTHIDAMAKRNRFGRKRVPATEPLRGPIAQAAPSPKTQSN